MPLKNLTIQNLGGGIRNDVMSQLIQPNEAWDSLNEDTTINIGASNKRKGYYSVGTINKPVRGIFQDPGWQQKRLIFGGSRIYEFTPPSTLTELYTKFPGGEHNRVTVTPIQDLYKGLVYVISDGLNHPLYWNGLREIKKLPGNAPIGKCAVAHKMYMIFGNYSGGEEDLTIYDASNDSNVSVKPGEWVTVLNINPGFSSGNILGYIIETNCAGTWQLYIYNIEGWYEVNPIVKWVYYDTTHVSTIGSGKIPFYTENDILSFRISHSEAGHRNFRIRVLYEGIQGSDYSTGNARYPNQIKWCSVGNVEEWTIDNDTSAGSLRLDTTGGGAIIKMLPLDRDVFLVYLDSGTVIAMSARGGSFTFDYNTLGTGYDFIAGDAIVSYGGYHWALSSEGILRIGASGIERTSSYGKSRGIFKSLNANWKNCYAIVLEQDQKILIAYPRSGGSSLDGVIVYNIRTDSFDVWDTPFNILGACDFESTITVDSFAGILVDDMAGYMVDDPRLSMYAREIYGGDLDGEVYRLGWVNNDDGNDIVAYRETGYLIPESELGDKFWFRSIEIDADITDAVLTLEYKVDYEDTWHRVPDITLTETRSFVTKKFVRHINGVGRAIKIRWSNDSGKGYVVRNMTIMYEPVGRR